MGRVNKTSKLIKGGCKVFKGRLQNLGSKSLHKTIWVLLFENTLSFFSQAEEWQPLLVYRNSLVHGEGEVPVVPSKRPYARKRKYGSDDDDDDDDADYV